MARTRTYTISYSEYKARDLKRKAEAEAVEEEDGEFILAIESGMGYPDIVHTDREPKFSEYFK